MLCVLINLHIFHLLLHSRSMLGILVLLTHSPSCGDHDAKSFFVDGLYGPSFTSRNIALSDTGKTECHVFASISIPLMASA